MAIGGDPTGIRIAIINHGRINHDGPLEDILDRFSRHKIMDLQFAGSEVPSDLSRFGTIVECQPPRVRLEVPRQNIPKILSALLSNYSIEDVGVQERPLEEVIAELFASDAASASESGAEPSAPTGESIPSDGMRDLDLAAEQPVDS